MIDRSVPTDIDKTPITLERNPAFVEGTLYEIERWAVRTGQFQSIIHDNVVILHTGKIAVDHPDSAMFASGSLVDTNTYSFKDPCPDTVSRLKMHNDKQVANSQPATPSAKTIPSDITGEFIVNKYVVKQELSRFATAIANTIVDREWAQELLENCDNDGRSLIALLLAYGATATPKDHTLVRASYDTHIKRGVVGALTLDTFNEWYKMQARLRRHVQPGKISDADVCEHINSLFFKDLSWRDLYELRLEINKPNGDLDKTREMVREMLRSRKVSQELQEATMPTFAQGLTLTVKQFNKLSAAAASGDAARMQALLAAVDPDEQSGGEEGKALPRDGRYTPLPKDENGKPIKWVEGARPCPCGVNGGKHLRRDCTAFDGWADRKPGGKWVGSSNGNQDEQTAGAVVAQCSGCGADCEGASLVENSQPAVEDMDDATYASSLMTFFNSSSRTSIKLSAPHVSCVAVAKPRVELDDAAAAELKDIVRAAELNTLTLAGVGPDSSQSVEATVRPAEVGPTDSDGKTDARAPDLMGAADFRKGCNSQVFVSLFTVVALLTFAFSLGRASGTSATPLPVTKLSPPAASSPPPSPLRASAASPSLDASITSLWSWAVLASEHGGAPPGYCSTVSHGGASAAQWLGVPLTPQTDETVLLPHLSSGGGINGSGSTRTSSCSPPDLEHGGASEVGAHRSAAAAILSANTSTVSAILPVVASRYKASPPVVASRSKASSQVVASRFKASSASAASVSAGSPSPHGPSVAARAPSVSAGSPSPHGPSAAARAPSVSAISPSPHGPPSSSPNVLGGSSSLLDGSPTAAASLNNSLAAGSLEDSECGGATLLGASARHLACSRLARRRARSGLARSLGAVSLDDSLVAAGSSDDSLTGRLARRLARNSFA